MIDFSTVLTAVDGVTPLREGPGEDASALTLRTASVFALVRGYEDERALPPQKTFERGELARRISRAKKPLKLKAEEIAQLKDLIAKSMGPAAAVAAWPMLDPAVKVADDE